MITGWIVKSKTMGSINRASTVRSQREAKLKELYPEKSFNNGGCVYYTVSEKDDCYTGRNDLNPKDVIVFGHFQENAPEPNMVAIFTYSGDANNNWQTKSDVNGTTVSYKKDGDRILFKVDKYGNP